MANHNLKISREIPAKTIELGNILQAKCEKISSAILIQSNKFSKNKCEKVNFNYHSLHINKQN